jgi:prevent-host-death family protein
MAAHPAVRHEPRLNISQQVSRPNDTANAQKEKTRNTCYGQNGHFSHIIEKRKESPMTRVTATEFKNNIGAFSDAAMNEPVIITSHQRDRLVLLSADEYRRLTALPEAVTEEDKARVARGLERHRSTIMQLAQR